MATDASRCSHTGPRNALSGSSAETLHITQTGNVESEPQKKKHVEWIEQVPVLYVNERSTKNQTTGSADLKPKFEGVAGSFSSAIIDASTERLRGLCCEQIGPHCFNSRTPGSTKGVNQRISLAPCLREKHTIDECVRFLFARSFCGPLTIVVWF